MELGNVERACDHCDEVYPLDALIAFGFPDWYWCAMCMADVRQEMMRAYLREEHTIEDLLREMLDAGEVGRALVHVDMGVWA